MNIPDSIYESLGMQKPEPEPEKESKQFYNRKDRFAELKTATKENPVFARVSGRDLKDTLVACEGVGDMIFEVSKYETYTAPEAHFRVLEGEFKAQGRGMELTDIRGMEYVEATDELKDLYKTTMDSIHCEIYTKLYPEVNVPEEMSHYDAYCKRIEPLCEMKYNPEGVRTLDEAEAWILKNHPEEYISMCSKNNIGDFSWGAIPQAYDEGSLRWATRKGREEITREYAERNGFELGKFNYEKADYFMKKNHDKIAKQLEEQGLSLKESRVPSKSENEVMRKAAMMESAGVSAEDQFGV